MKQLERQKSVAWFKLAEFIERGEKERALGAYRLLALSISDKAFTYQLEGDILLAFEDKLANEKYLQAAEHYLKQNNVPAAVGTLNHLVLIEPNNKKHWTLLTKIYLENYPESISVHLQNLLSCSQTESAQECITEVVNKYLATNNKKALDGFLEKIKKLDTKLYEFALQVSKK